MDLKPRNRFSIRKHFSVNKSSRVVNSLSLDSYNPVNSDISTASTLSSPELFSPNDKEEDEFLFLNRYLGQWKFYKKRSDLMDSVSKELGVGWAMRKAVDQFTPVCRYFRPEHQLLQISQLLPMGVTKDIYLHIDNEIHRTKDSDVGEWTSITTPNFKEMSLTTIRERVLDGMHLTETRKILTERFHLNGLPDITSDVLWYFVEVRRKADQEVIASANRYFTREECPPPGTLLPRSIRSWDDNLISVIKSLDELQLVSFRFDSNSKSYVIRLEGDEETAWLTKCSGSRWICCPGFFTHPSPRR